MPLTFGIPLGLILIVAGIVAAFVFKKKVAGLIAISIGFLIALVTGLLVILVVNSSM